MGLTTCKYIVTVTIVMCVVTSQISESGHQI